jgi:hypothetical protein
MFSGEPCLKVAANHENNALNDKDSRSKGPKIDMIFRNTKLNIDVPVLEISGPNSQVNQVHNLEDYFKIAKILKTMLLNLHSTALYATPIEKKEELSYMISIFIASIKLKCISNYILMTIQFSKQAYNIQSPNA